MKQDRFLLGILIAIGLLVIAAFALFLIRPQEQTYGDDNTPDGTVRNYVLALHNSDYEKAYGYLQTAENMPTLEEFRQVFLRQELEIERLSIQIQDSEQAAEEAVVNLVINHGGGSPFGSSWRENTSAILTQEQGSWKIVSMPYPYWYWDWYTVKPVR